MISLLINEILPCVISKILQNSRNAGYVQSTGFLKTCIQQKFRRISEYLLSSQLTLFDEFNVSFDAFVFSYSEAFRWMKAGLNPFQSRVMPPT
jgi:hypothetical protein